MLSVANHFVQSLPRLVIMRRSNDKLFNLLELMDAEDAFGVATVGADLLAEAAGQAGVLDGQALLADPFVPVESGDGLLRGGPRASLEDVEVVAVAAGLQRQQHRVVGALARRSHGHLDRGDAAGDGGGRLVQQPPLTREVEAVVPGLEQVVAVEDRVVAVVVGEASQRPWPTRTRQPLARRAGPGPLVHPP